MRLLGYHRSGRVKRESPARPAGHAVLAGRRELANADFDEVMPVSRRDSFLVARRAVGAKEVFFVVLLQGRRLRR
jgi:hypothetical protein